MGAGHHILEGMAKLGEIEDDEIYAQMRDYPNKNPHIYAKQSVISLSHLCSPIARAIPCARVPSWRL